MSMECDMRKRVSDLENIGRKICSDLRNFQKERTILSQEAKCLLRKIEKGQVSGRRYSKKKQHNNTKCTCSIWENDLIKNNEDVLEESSKFQKEDEQLLTCENSCECRNFLDEENDFDDLFEIGDCSICRFNKLDDTFHCTQSATIVNHDNDDNDDNDGDDSHNFNKNSTVEDNVNDAYRTMRSSEASLTDPTEFCNVCVFCKENNLKNIHVSPTKHELNTNNESDIRDLIERQRGGGGRSDSESTNDETTTSICTCDCDICALRNKHGDKLPCCLQENEQLCSSIDIDYDESFQSNRSVVSELSDVHQYCKITKLREALEKLKNHNHILRKLLKTRDCLVTSSTIGQANYELYSSPNDRYDDNNFGKGSKCPQDECKETPRELTGILKILQSKCRTKDGMIVALADELRECATNERTTRILAKLTDTNVHCGDIIDFDRSTLWKYLVSKQSNSVEEHSRRRESIVCRKLQCSEITIGIVMLSFIFLANIHYRYRCTAIFIFRTTCETFYRAYEILQNLQQCFASNHVIMFIMKNCIHSLDTFLSLFNCRQVGINIEKITRCFTFFSDDSFPWLSTIFICAAIFILFSSYCTCYPFIAMCSGSLRYIYDMHGNSVQNECE